jgi:dolichol-phosphate mannosyltransferase
MPRLLLLLPCFNEAGSLPELLTELAAVRTALPSLLQREVLVVADGSSDGTTEVAVSVQGMGVQLLRHEQNLGLGAALRSGIEWFAQHCGPRDLLATMDADLTHPPALLPQMLAVLDAGAELVIASRYAPGGREYGLSLLRRCYSRGASLLLGLAARIPGVRDYTCGYRLYTHAAIMRGRSLYGSALISETSFVCMAELLCKLAACGTVCREVPLELHYERKRGPSKMNVPVTIRRYVSLVGRLLFTREFRGS